MTKLPKITIYALHMNFGGVEVSLAQTANMLADDYQVELVVFYNFGLIPFEINPRVKVVYLTNLQPNRQQLKQALRGQGNLIKELIRAVKIWYWRRALVKQHIRHNSADILISSRVLYHDLIGKYRQKWQLAICQEHVDHKNNARYLKKLVQVIKKCDYLMPVSQFLADDYAKISPIAVEYIPHAVELPERVKYKPSKRLISVGRLSKEKGFVDLIKMMSLLHQSDPEFRLDIYGDGAEWAALKKEIDDLGLASVIKLHGFQPPEVIHQAMAEASLYLMASYEESFGLVLVEAMSHGLPVVVFDSARGAQEIVGQGGGLLIAGRDLNQMAQTVAKLSDDELKHLSQEAVIVARRYDYQAVKKQWLDFLKNAKLPKI